MTEVFAFIILLIIAAFWVIVVLTGLGFIGMGILAVVGVIVKIFRESS